MIAPAPASALEVRNLRLAFGGVQALDGVSLAVPPGARVGVIGPNGAGKTTLFDAICGFVAVDSGHVVVNGVDVRRLDPADRARVGLARSFQDARLFPSMTVHEALMVAATPRRRGLGHVPAMLGFPVVRRAERASRERVDQLLEEMGLRGYRDVFIGELSTGTRRVVDLAGVLARDPALILLDEPSAGLAQAEVEQLAPLLQRVASSTGAAVVMIEHDIPLVAAFAEHLVVLESGRVIARGEPTEVLADPLVIEAYLGGDERTIARSGRAKRRTRA